MSYDLIVLGAGPAGYLAAERAGQAGMKVVCVESEHLGGTCLNEGCIPTKTLLYSAKLYDGIRHGEAYGVTAENLQVNQAAVVQRKNKVVDTLVKGVGAALRASKVMVKMGDAKILPRTGAEFRVQVGDEVLEATRLLIATGSETVIPPISGVEAGMQQGFVLTSKEMLNLKTIPKTMVIVGGGVIGLEFASYFNSVGSTVTVVEMMDQIAGQIDRDAANKLRKIYRDRGIRILLNTKVCGIDGSCVQCRQGEQSYNLLADCVLLSIGREARTSNLGLENIGVITERGAVVTDEHMQTNVPNVYAAGDVNGKSMLAHVAYREAEVAVNNMLGKRDTMRYSAVPSVLYTNPEFSSVGETEASAKEKGMDVTAVQLPMEYAGRYVAENEEGGGFCKIVICNRTRRIVGAQFLGTYSSEFLVALASLIEIELPIDDIKEIMFPHPTVSEIIKEAISLYKPSK